MKRHELGLLAATILAVSSFTPGQEFRLRDTSPLAGFGQQRFFAADVDGSGLPDVVYKNQTTDLVYIADPGTDGFLPPSSTLLSSSSLPGTSFTGVFAHALEDMDGDGIVDLVIDRNVFLQPWIIYLVRGTGSGSFAPPQQVGTSSQIINTVRTGDFNGDGLRDVIATVNFPPEVAIFLQTPTGFVLGHTEPVGALNYVVEDFDGDGDDDVFFFTAVGTGRVLTGDPSGNIGTGGTVAISPNATAIRPGGDLNGDGLPDVLVVRMGSGMPFELSLLLGHAAGVLVPGPILTPAATSTTAGLEPFDVTVMDLDVDGRDDVVVDVRQPGSPAGFPSELLGYRGDDTGSISSVPSVTATLASGFREVLLADFDDDGDRDLTVYSMPDLVRFENRALYGNACAGAGGDPTLVVGAARPGNQAFTISLANAAPNTPAEIFIATADYPAACGVLFDPTTIAIPTPYYGPFSLTTDASGATTLALPIPPSIAPTPPFYIQGIVIDPAGTFAGGGLTFATTRGHTLGIF